MGYNWNLPNDVVDADYSLRFTFVIGDGGLSHQPTESTIFAQETIATRLRLSFIYHYNDKDDSYYEIFSIVSE